MPFTARKQKSRQALHKQQLWQERNDVIGFVQGTRADIVE